MAINVLVADRERAFADALAARLATESEIDVVGTVQLRMPRPRLIASASADVVVLDGDMPGQVADRLCEELSGRDPPTRIVTLSSSSEPARIVQAIRAGVAAWVRKDESLDHLLCVIRGVARGKPGCPQPKPETWCDCCCKSRIGSARPSACWPCSHHVNGKCWLAWSRAPHAAIW